MIHHETEAIAKERFTNKIPNYEDRCWRPRCMLQGYIKKKWNLQVFSQMLLAPNLLFHNFNDRLLLFRTELRDLPCY